MSTQDLILTWGEIDTAAVQLAPPMRSYLVQVATTLRPGSVVNADRALRCFAQFLIQQHPEISTLTDVRRTHIEDYKPWLASASEAGPSASTPEPTAWATYAPFSSASTTGAGPRPHPPSPSSSATCPARSNPSPRPSMTPTPRSSCAPLKD